MNHRDTSTKDRKALLYFVDKSFNNKFRYFKDSKIIDFINRHIDFGENEGEYNKKNLSDWRRDKNYLKK